MDDLGYITDGLLRKNIEDSIEYVYALFEESKKEGSLLYKDETYRVIILYIVSVIEAVLLYLYKKLEKEITQIEYRFICQLPEEYKHTDEKDSKTVIAVQKNTKKTEHQIGLFELTNFLRESKVIKDETVKEILKINDVRNTFHLSKSRDKIRCNIKDVEAGFKLLVHVMQGTRRTLLKMK